MIYLFGQNYRKSETSFVHFTKLGGGGVFFELRPKIKGLCEKARTAWAGGLVILSTVINRKNCMTGCDGRKYVWSTVTFRLCIKRGEFAERTLWASVEENCITTNNSWKTRLKKEPDAQQHPGRRRRRNQRAGKGVSWVGGWVK